MTTEHIDAYFNFLRRLSIYADKTLSAYRGDIEAFIYYIDGASQITNQTIEEYTKFLSEKYKPATVARRLLSLSGFLSYLKQEYRILWHIDSIEPYYVPPIEKKHLTRREISKLFDVTLDKEDTTKSNLLTIRNLAIVSSIYSTGIPASELSALSLDSFLASGTETILRYYSLKGEEVDMPLPDAAIHYMYSYIKYARPLLINSKGTDTLFLNHLGERLTRQGIFDIIRRHAKKCGLKQPVSPSMIRHSFSMHRQERQENE